MMKGSVVCFVLLLLPFVMHARHIGKLHSHNGSSKEEASEKPDLYVDHERAPLMHRRADTLQIAGSRLPDCSHACGSCTPCRLVMVSFVCSSLEEAETCPMAYKCMCHNKSYPVP
ncbi:epidermal patterning factor 1 [Olea europaea subsp. europaea]|uniref:Epidermal patterning factor-like protein n=1 Tax=Olea europaea subsp. europaea TaxID=158383 RepID=A0A8S0UKD3_OLEEU|nr:epidermal patterning factor 1 [Olea europaea subsp. europaea]